MLLPTWTDIQTVAAGHANEFLTQLPLIRDGRAEGVHRARLAARRLREILPMIGDDSRSTEAEAVLAKVRRQLGSVRDLDVMLEVLERKTVQVPGAALAIAASRRTLTARVRAERRLLIKTLEDLELDRLAALRDPRGIAELIRLEPLRRRVRVMPTLRERIHLRADRLVNAVAHAAGVYFPNRLHSVRIAAKQLRYAVEAAADLGVWKPARLLGDLKKIQNRLGEMHDAQLLRNALPTLVDSAVPLEETAALVGALDVDIARLHDLYLRRRARLQLIAEHCGRYASNRSLRRAALRSALRLIPHRAS